jgi:hypothetical protein
MRTTVSNIAEIARFMHISIKKTSNPHHFTGLIEILSSKMPKTAEKASNQVLLPV